MLYTLSTKGFFLQAPEKAAKNVIGIIIFFILKRTLKLFIGVSLVSVNKQLSIIFSSHFNFISVINISLVLNAI